MTDSKDPGESPGWSSGSFNPIVPWSELERRLSGRPRKSADRATPKAPLPSSHASETPPPTLFRQRAVLPYVELHCHSNFSFLDGASNPEELVDEAVRLGLEALALTDHNGLYGVVRFAAAARSAGLGAIIGSELSFGSGKKMALRSGSIDPQAEHLVVLSKGHSGYARLSAAIGKAQLAGGEKGRPKFSIEALADAAAGEWFVLTACRHGAVPRALEQEGPRAAARELARLIDAFGRDSVIVELSDHGTPIDQARNDALAALAVQAGVSYVATTNAHYATPGQHRLASTLGAIRARQSLEEAKGYLPAWGSASLRSGAEQHRRFARYPGAIEMTLEVGRACAFDLTLVAPGLPPFAEPGGMDETTLLRHLSEAGGTRRYGPRGSPGTSAAWAQIDRELEIIATLGFSGYFLVVQDIVEFCRRNNIFCQGRGSAANSAICYALGITNADAVALGLLFERFLSTAREGPPDIDIDIESGRRDEVIAYVYERYGREHAAQVANVITYRPLSAVRDVGRALGYPEEQINRWSKELQSMFSHHVPSKGDGGGTAIPKDVLVLAGAIEDFPRHLGVHSGGMVICDRPVIEVCPVEWARREGRTVLQWDKDDCAAIGLVKFDLLGLGMLEALHHMVDLAKEAGIVVDLAMLPQEDGVYTMLSQADSMGVFQVESRAQMATLPRLRPETFYDLVVEVALIRPGPIQGGSVHPYLRRRAGEEEVTYLHPLLVPALQKTLGVPLFQEQLMQIAIDVAGFSPTDADELRQAMGSKRSAARMERLRDRLYSGMAERGVGRDVADAIIDQLVAFANYGFPESHAVSFAYLVYASAWFKLHYPAVFLAGLLNAQPMGFWSPQSLVADARRHGVVVLRPDVNVSEARATVGREEDGHPVVQLGLVAVRGLGNDAAAKIAELRPFSSMDDLARRSGVTKTQLEMLATAGACDGLSALGGGVPMGSRVSPRRVGRREALWAAGALATSGAARLPGIVVGAIAPELREMSDLEIDLADLVSTGITTERHPVGLLRASLNVRGVLSAEQVIFGGTDEGKVLVAGVVTHRQRPSTAGGTVFLNLEDETGLINVICSPGCWVRHRTVVRSPGLVVRGRLERAGAVCSVVAERLWPLGLGTEVGRARDFR
jgi:error-prone DNA polymerase